MFSSWDLVRPRFWYPMSSLEQSMMDCSSDDIEDMNNVMMRPHFPFDMHREVLAAPDYMEDSDVSDSVEDDDFFVDLPVVARKYNPTELQLVGVVPTSAPEEESDEGEATAEVFNAKAMAKADSDTYSNTDMDVDNEGENTQSPSKNSSKTVQAVKIATPKPKSSTIKRHHKNKKHSKKLHSHSNKVTPATEQKVTPKTATGTFSSYSFSNSSVVDDKGRRVTTTRRRYEDSAGRLKAVHEREIDGKKLRTTWSRQSKGDEGKHESICSSGSPEEFEVLWQQTPFGEAQKKTVKAQLQSQSDLENEVPSTTAALEDTTMEEVPVKKASTKKARKAATKKSKTAKASAKMFQDDDESKNAEE